MGTHNMRTHRSDAGFSLAALIFFATAASILAAAAVPAYKMQAKREMEEELIFRGEEYMRAIQKYQRRFGVYPSSIDQLISTNGLRFLRRKYEDPFTGKEFRLITVNPDGSLNGSKVFLQNMKNQPLFGNTQTFGQQPNTQQPSQQQFPQTQQQGQQRGFQPAGQQQPQPGLGGAGVGVPSAFGTQRNPVTQPGQRGFQSPGQPQQLFTSPSAAGQVISASGVIGVASDNSEESIKVYNNRQKYDEWEFLAILGQPGLPGQQQPNPQQPQQPGQPGFGQPGFGQPGFGQPGPGQRQNNPFQNVPGGPFGGAPAASPFGPAGGQRQMQTPFGFGGAPQPAPQPAPRR